MKYIMFKREMTSVAHYVPILFSETLIHSDVAKAMIDGPLKDYKVHSGGFLSSVEIPSSVYGGSETLGVQHDPKDTHRINMSDYGGCFE